MKTRYRTSTEISCGGKYLRKAIADAMSKDTFSLCGHACLTTCVVLENMQRVAMRLMASMHSASHLYNSRSSAVVFSLFLACYISSRAASCRIRWYNFEHGTILDKIKFESHFQKFKFDFSYLVVAEKCELIRIRILINFINWQIHTGTGIYLKFTLFF